MTPPEPPEPPTVARTSDAAALAFAGTRRIAVVGLSDDPGRESHGVARSLLDAGFEVVPVNPMVDEVLGQPAYPDLASVPGRIDMVDVFRREEHLPGIAEEAVARDDVAVVWMQTGLRSAAARETVTTARRVYVEDACTRVVVSLGARPPVGPRLEAEVVLLDLDDTVLDHDACERGAVAATLAAFDLDTSDPAIDTYVRHNAALWDAYRDGAVTPETLRTERWERTLRELGLTADVDAVAAHYLDAFAATDGLLPGAAAAVWWLARRSRVAICTNGFRDVQRARSAATGIDRMVDVIVSSEESGAAKPDPATLQLALERLGYDGEPAGVAVVGDQLGTDVAAGHAIGATTVWIAPPDAVVPAGAPQPDVHVARLVDVA